MLHGAPVPRAALADVASTGAGWAVVGAPSPRCGGTWLFDRDCLVSHSSGPQKALVRTLSTSAFFFFFFNFYLFIYLFFFNLWLCWVFVSVQGLSLVVASGDHSSSRCAGLSLSRPLLLRSTGSRRAGSVVVAHGLSCSAACGIFPDQSSNPCPLHWQADSQPLRHQGNPAHLL